MIDEHVLAALEQALTTYVQKRRGEMTNKDGDRLREMLLELSEMAATYPIGSTTAVGMRSAAKAVAYALKGQKVDVVQVKARQRIEG